MDVAVRERCLRCKLVQPIILEQTHSEKTKFAKCSLWRWADSLAPDFVSPSAIRDAGSSMETAGRETGG